MPTVLELSQHLGFKGRADLIDTAVAIADPQYHLSVKVYDFWHGLLEQGRPSRQQIDPISLGPQILPYLVLIDVIDAGQDYRWRLFGSRHIEEYGANLSGMALSEVIADNPEGAVFKHVLDATMDSAGPQFFNMTYSSSNDVKRTAVGAIFPLWDEGEQPTVLFGVADWIAETD